jgi:short-subunit dehydrogenase
LRTEAAGLGIRVSVVCPGFIKTSLNDSATLLKMTKDDFFGLIKFEPMSSGKAAKIILKRVSKNRGIIVLTAAAHILWRINRISPAAGDLIIRLPAWFVRKKIRKE